jgi:hypothetical protein
VILGEHAVRTLAFFLEGEFTLLVVVLVLSSTSILASLCAVSIVHLIVVAGYGGAESQRVIVPFPCS